MTKKVTKRDERSENQEVINSKEAIEKQAQENKNKQEVNTEADNQTASTTDSKPENQKKKPTAKKKTKKITSVQEWQNKIDAAEESGKEWQNKFMRLSAEFDNYRKRTLKEKIELTKQANSNLLREILPVIDDFDRGRENIDKSDNIEGLKQGISLIYTTFIEFIGQNGVKEIEAKEQEFDINFHEALTKIPAPTEDLKGKVVDVIEKGYLLNDKVIRYAKVIVGE